MKSSILSILILGYKTLACLQEGNCRTTSEGCLQVCASGYWQNVAIEGYECYNDVLVPKKLYVSDSASVLVGPPVQATLPSSTELASVLVGPPIQFPLPSSSGSIPELHTSPLPDTSSDIRDVGHWYCSGMKPPTKDNKAFTASYRKGGSMASVYYAEQAIFRCDIQPPKSNYYVAVWTRYVPGQISQPPPKNCNEWLTLENPKNRRTATALIIDRCASCVGVGHQMSDLTVSDSYVNGATIDLSPDVFRYLYEGMDEGVYDIIYNGSIYGGSWDGDPDNLIDPTCAV